jgi:hypothetical protein
LASIIGVFVVAGVVGYVGSVEARAQEAIDVPLANTVVDMSDRAAIVKKDVSNLFNSVASGCTDPATSCSEITRINYKELSKRLFIFEIAVQSIRFVSSVINKAVDGYMKYNESIEPLPIPPYPTGTATSPSSNVIPTSKPTPEPPSLPKPVPAKRPVYIAY